MAAPQPGRATRMAALVVWAALALAVYGGVLELVATLFAGATAIAAIAATAGSVFLGLWVGAAAGVLLFLLELGLSAAGLQRRAGIQTVGVFVALFAVAWWLLNPPMRAATLAYVILVIAAAAGVAMAHWLTRAHPPHLARLAAILIALAATAADVVLETSAYPKLHMLAFIVATAGVLSATIPVLGRLAAHRRLLVAAAALPLVSVAFLVSASALDSGWRWTSFNSGRSLSTLGAPIRRLADFDGDGFSAVLGGMDCDDFDRDRHPYARETPGGADANCNGSDLPDPVEPRHRGLTDAFGNAALAPGEVDLVLFITIDCWRADALGPVITPNLWGFAKDATVLTRTYAAGSSTRYALPFTAGPSITGPWVAPKLREHGIMTSAVFGVGVAIEHWGMPQAESADGAEQTTRAVLKTVRKHRGTPHFLWTHYYDLHQPYRFEAATAPRGPAHLDPVYRASLHHADHWIGQLLDTLRAEGVLERAVVIITSDHGEGLGDHGVPWHGRTAFDSIVRVPAVVFGPGMAARETGVLASHRDIPPTLLGAFGLRQATEEFETFGRSWWRLRTDPKRELHDFVFVRSARRTSGRKQFFPVAAVVSGSYKLVVGLEDGFRELYDLVEDPGELVNVVDDHPDVTTALQHKLGVAADLDGFPRDIRADLAWD